jgi:hypothetical protein
MTAVGCELCHLRLKIPALFICVLYMRIYKSYCTGETTHNNLKLDKDKEIEFCQEYKYLGVIFDTSGTDD